MNFLKLLREKWKELKGNVQGVEVEFLWQSMLTGIIVGSVR